MTQPRAERGRFARDPRRPLVVRLAEKISPERPVYVRELGPCWPWAGARTPRGYGRIRDDAGRLIYAHRAALALALKRPLRPGMFANHRCDWKACVRPSHLYEGTQSENERDKAYWGPVIVPKGDVIEALHLFEEEVASTPITA